MGNGRVKEARKLSRRSIRAGRRLFLADGPNAVEGALGRADCVVEVFATPAAAEQYAGLAATGPPWTLVDDRALASLSDSVSPAGVVAVCRFLDVPLERLLHASVGPVGTGLLAVLADVRDPGNAGTVVRTADAAGADGVVLASSSVDLHNPKTIRASVGSVFHLPVAVDPDPGAVVRAARAAGFSVLAADSAGTVALHEAGDLLRQPVAWLLGNEARGLGDELTALADHRVRIPIHGAAESLNLSTAAALCLYESVRALRG